MKKVCLVSNLHLSSNPRLWKEANSLAGAGYKVVILTIWTSAEKRDRDLLLLKHPDIQYKAAVNIIKGESSKPSRFYRRAQRRLGMELKRYLKIDNKWILDYAPAKMLATALEEEADLYICHTEYGMLIGRELIGHEKKVAFDIEDWYSRDYLVPSRPVKLLERLERFALRKGVYCTCPSHAMAAALRARYGEGPVHVIYNGFSIDENGFPGHLQPKKEAHSNPSLIWFSQTIGPGRGLETLIFSLGQLNTNVELHLLGKSDKSYEDQLRKIFPVQKGHKLFFHSPVPHDHLLAELAKHDIGLALEQRFPESRDTTITNKILQYLQAGLKILATATLGQQEVAKIFPQAIETVSLDKAADWAKAIEKLMQRPVDKNSQIEKFKRVFSWETQENKLLQLIEKAVAE